jgi:hypothetical protein
VEYFKLLSQNSTKHKDENQIKFQGSMRFEHGTCRMQVKLSAMRPIPGSIFAQSVLRQLPFTACERLLLLLL